MPYLQPFWRFSVKEWPDLEIWVWGPSRSLKMARSAIVTTGCGQKNVPRQNVIFSQTDRKFKTKFSTLIPDIYAHISIKYYWIIWMNRTMRLIWNESLNFAIYQLKSSVKQCFKQVVFIKYLPSTIFKIYDVIYDVIVYVIYDFSLRTVVHYMVIISFSNMTPHQLTRQNWLKPGCQLTVVTSSINTLGRLVRRIWTRWIFTFGCNVVSLQVTTKLTQSHTTLLNWKRY